MFSYLQPIVYVLAASPHIISDGFRLWIGCPKILNHCLRSMKAQKHFVEGRPVQEEQKKQQALGLNLYYRILLQFLWFQIAACHHSNRFQKHVKLAKFQKWTSKIGSVYQLIINLSDPALPPLVKPGKPLSPWSPQTHTAWAP